jgi:fatty-acid desaturase
MIGARDDLTADCTIEKSAVSVNSVRPPRAETPSGDRGMTHDHLRSGGSRARPAIPPSPDTPGSVSLTWNGKSIDWTNVVYFTLLHLGALHALWTFSWPALGVFAALLWVSFSLGIGVTYHRLLTHRGFRIPKPLEHALTVCGMLASEGGAISWVAIHRMHHVLSDRPGRDPHTPKDGFWWSHVGWIITRLGQDMREVEERHAPELVADPVHRVLNRLHVVPNVLVGLALYAWGGWPFVVWGVFLRLVIGLHATWFVNSAAHTWG